MGLAAGKGELMKRFHHQLAHRVGLWSGHVESLTLFDRVYVYLACGDCERISDFVQRISPEAVKYVQEYDG